MNPSRTPSLVAELQSLGTLYVGSSSCQEHNTIRESHIHCDQQKENLLFRLHLVDQINEMDP